MREENKIFVDWYGSLKRHEQSYFREEISELCGVTRTTVYKWLEGDVKIKLPYKRIINQISGVRVFDVDKLSPVFRI